MKLNSYLRLLRPHQWLKNILIFPLFFLTYKSLAIILDLDIWLIFICFCVVSSGVYCANDVIDIDSDKNHPTKKFRPIASGDLSTTQGILFASVMLISGLCLSLYVSKSFFIIISIYLLLNILYNLFLKKIVYIDVFVLTSFYILRIICPISIAEINLSYWFISFAFFLFLSLAFLKRCIDFSSKHYIGIVSSSKLKDLFFIFSIVAFTASLSVLISFFNSSEFIASYKKIFLVYILIIPYVYLYLNLTTAVKFEVVKGDPLTFLLTDIKSLITLFISALIFIMAIV